MKLRMYAREKKDDFRWYAARIAGAQTNLARYLDLEGIRHYSTRFAPGIVFMRCDLEAIRILLSFFWGKVFFYLDAEKKNPEPIPEKDMNIFILVTSASDDLIPLGEVSEKLLEGDRVCVISGVFEGAEGVVKRIKGDRRLIISIKGMTAVATCFIRPEFLRKI